MTSLARHDAFRRSPRRQARSSKQRRSCLRASFSRRLLRPSRARHGISRLRVRRRTFGTFASCRRGYVAGLRTRRRGRSLRGACSSHAFSFPRLASRESARTRLRNCSASSPRCFLRRLARGRRDASFAAFDPARLSPIASALLGRRIRIHGLALRTRRGGARGSACGFARLSPPRRFSASPESWMCARLRRASHGWAGHDTFAYVLLAAALGHRSVAARRTRSSIPGLRPRWDAARARHSSARYTIRAAARPGRGRRRC